MNQFIEKKSTVVAPQFAEVAVPLRLRQTFTYRLPTAFAAQTKLGARLVVPFRKQQITAYVVALHTELDSSLEIEADEIKDALELIDVEPLITPEILKLTHWIADYYLASWGEVLKISLPAGVNASIEQIAAITPAGHDEILRLTEKQAATTKAQILKTVAEKSEISVRDLSKAFGEAAAKRAVRDLESRGWVKIFHRALSAQAKPKRRKAVRLLAPENHTNGGAKKLTEAQNKVVEFLIQNGGEFEFTQLLESAAVSSSAINTLEKRGILETFVKEVRRDPLGYVKKLPLKNDFVLTAGQSAVLHEIISAINQDSYAAFLLHGVTGSGKTEVYIRAMQCALQAGKTALMLVPEIALTPVFSRRLRAHFGDETAILHSSLSTGERFDEWRRIRRGEARLVIGTRSAVFAPLENLGVIIVDEEHDGSYKQQDAPYYHGRDVAVVRAHQSNAVVILGSATPALESFHNANSEKYRYLTLPNRVGDRPMASAEIVDMREAFKEDGKDAIFSSELLQAIAETHSRGEQSIVLLNRRGYSQFVLCRSCGETVKCPNCDVTLTFHKRESALVCHYCNHRQRTPKICPACSSKYIYFLGEGTEQIEDILRARFPDLRIARVDRDTTLKKRLLDETLHNFAEHKIDMLVGTQMLAKGHDFPNVTLVGVVSVDVGLALPDFRAAERTFQLITQVAGRAGRGTLAGKVIIQTFYPEHYALRHACAQDYGAFYEVERKFRQHIGYPPFCALASFLIHHDDYAHAVETADILRNCLERANKENACRILGAAPAPLARLKNEFRFQILVKAKNRKKLRETIDFALHEAEELKCNLRAVNLEIDPINML
jgi:primosomal protein N' (replication factor Y) (superfamily II helicase)